MDEHKALKEINRLKQLKKQYEECLTSETASTFTDEGKDQIRENIKDAQRCIDELQIYLLG